MAPHAEDQVKRRPLVWLVWVLPQRCWFASSRVDQHNGRPFVGYSDHL